MNCELCKAEVPKREIVYVVMESHEEDPVPVFRYFCDIYCVLKDYLRTLQGIARDENKIEVQANLTLAINLVSATEEALEKETARGASSDPWPAPKARSW